MAMAASGHDHLVKYLRDYLIGTDIVGLGLICEPDTVAENVMAYSAHVFRDNIPALAQEGIRLGRTGQRD